MTTEHLDSAEVERITVVEFQDGCEQYVVGRGGVTRIEAFTKSGMYADIAYVRVWAGDRAVAEFCQHNILGVYFAQPAKATGKEG